MEIYNLHHRRRIEVHSGLRCLNSFFFDITVNDLDGGAILHNQTGVESLHERTRYEKCSCIKVGASFTPMGGGMCIIWAGLVVNSCCFTRCVAADNGGGISSGRKDNQQGTPYGNITNCAFWKNGDATKTTQDANFYIVADRIVINGLNSSDNQILPKLDGKDNSEIGWKSTLEPTEYIFSTYVNGTMQAIWTMGGNSHFEQSNFINGVNPCIRFGNPASTVHTISNCRFIGCNQIATDNSVVTVTNCYFTSTPSFSANTNVKSATFSTSGIGVDGALDPLSFHVKAVEPICGQQTEQRAPKMVPPHHPFFVAVLPFC